MQTIALDNLRLSVVLSPKVSWKRMIQEAQFVRIDRRFEGEHFICTPLKEGKVTLFVARIQTTDILATSDILTWMADSGMRPALAIELLSLAAQQPRLELACNPYALGSVWKDQEARPNVIGCRLRYTRLLRVTCLRSEPRWTGADWFPCASRVE